MNDNESPTHIFIKDTFHVSGYLKQVRQIMPDALLFLRRFSWLPLNLPVNIDGFRFPSSESLLTNTTNSAQVLTNYWITKDSLEQLIINLDPEILDVGFFSANGLRYAGSLRYFEWYLDLDLFQNNLLELPSLDDISKEDKKAVGEHDYLQDVYGMSPTGQMERRLSAESLSILGNIVLKTTLGLLGSVAVIDKTTCSSPALVSTLTEVATGRCHYALTDYLGKRGLEDFSWLADCDNNALPQDTIQELPFGSVLCLNENGKIIGGAEKQFGGTDWCVFAVE